MNKIALRQKAASHTVKGEIAVLDPFVIFTYRLRNVGQGKNLQSRFAKNRLVMTLYLKPTLINL